MRRDNKARVKLVIGIGVDVLNEIVPYVVV